MLPEPDRFQASFHRRWQHLHDPHVRSLAWLLDSPGLLDPDAARWDGKIATLAIEPMGLAQWLSDLDAAPRSLHEHLNVGSISRLGRYAESLMAFYFTAQGSLVAHGLQVQAARNDTIGEFDFLLREDGHLVHWELATKFYLFEAPGKAEDGDYFIGPNLADTLGAKMQKILQRQLALSMHPAAQAYLPQSVLHARALIKGWLFYSLSCDRDDRAVMAASGVAAAHCNGFWCPLAEFDRVGGERFVVLPRLTWLAPARVPLSDGLSHAAMALWLGEHFAQDAMPVMVAVLHAQSGDPQTDAVAMGLEVARGFIVPDDWRARAGDRMQRTVLRTGGS